MPRYKPFNEDCTLCFPEKAKVPDGDELYQDILDIYNATFRIERLKVWQHFVFSDLAHPLSWNKKAEAIRARHIMQDLATMGE
jgi:hypothetical protein